MKKRFFINKKMVGWLEDKTFRKIVSGKLHLFKKTDSWGMDAQVLKDLPDDGEIRIKDTDDGLIYVSTVAHFRQFGVYLHFKEDKVDHRAQIFLWRDFFDVIKDGVLTKSEKREQTIENLRWFDEYPCGCEECKKLRDSGQPAKH